MSDRANPSFGAKLGMIGLIIESLGNFFYAIVLVSLRKGYRVSTAVSYLLQKLSLKASTDQMQWLLRPTPGAYKTVGRFVGFKPDIVEFEDRSAALWMGPRNAKQTIVYFHGGGFYVPATVAHVKWLWDIRTHLTKKGTETAVVMLSYTLAPQAQYPVQLKQAVRLMKYVLEEEKIPPSQIIIGGDSAGGNLTLAVLSHLLHPHPEVPPLKLSAPLLGTMLISPWITFDHDDAPKSKKYQYDMLMVQTGKWFLGSAPPDNYNEPINAPATWWKGLCEQTASVYVWCGTEEMLNPSIHAIAGALEKHSDLTLVTDAGATHVSTIIDNACPGSFGVDKGTLAWLESRYSPAGRK